MGSVERCAIIRRMECDVARMKGCHETIAWLTARPSPCTIRPDPPPHDDEDEPTAGIHAPQDIHPHH
jgi:hypothetical protein